MVKGLGCDGSKKTRKEGARHEMGSRPPKPLSELRIQAQLRQEYRQQYKRRSFTRKYKVNQCKSSSFSKRESFHQTVSEIP
jgi:hypothetical protein